MNREFRVRIKRGNEDKVQVPIWIPLSIIAKGAAISHGTSSYAAEAVVDAVIGHGGVVANRSRGGRYVDAMGEVSVASKVSALALSKAGGSNEAATAVENAVLGWGGYLVAFIYANNVVILDGNSNGIPDGYASQSGTRNGRREGYTNRDTARAHNPLWKVSLETFSSSSSSSSSNMNNNVPTYPKPNDGKEDEPIVEYYKTNVDNVVSQNKVKRGEQQQLSIPMDNNTQQGINSSSAKMYEMIDKDSRVDTHVIQSSNPANRTMFSKLLSNKKKMIGILTLLLLFVIVGVTVGVVKSSDKSNVSTSELENDIDMVDDEAACDEDKGLGPTPRPSATILVDLPPPVPETTILPSCPPPYDQSKTTYVVGDMVEVKSNIFTCSEEDGYEVYCNIPHRPKDDENAEMMWRNAWIHLGPCTLEEVEDKDNGDGNGPIRALRASASKDEKPLLSLSSILTPRHIDYSAHKPVSSSHHGSKASKNKKCSKANKSAKSGKSSKCTDEGEECRFADPDIVNGGCFFPSDDKPPTYMFGNIAFGQSICGTISIFDPFSPEFDTDWFKFTVPEPENRTVSATLTADFAADSC